MNPSDSERYELAYRRVWGALHRGDEADLGQHERQVLHHVPAEGGVALSWLARHLALPKSSTSVLVKDLERRGFVRRARDPRDERRLAIVLTGQGRRRVAADTVLEPARLARALDALPARRRAALLAGMEALADAAERLSRADPPDRTEPQQGPGPRADPPDRTEPQQGPGRDTRHRGDTSRLS